MASIKLSLNIAASPERVYRCAHFESDAWDPLGKKMHCITENGIVALHNRLKITAWHGQSMVVEYIHVSAPFKVAMKMILGPRYLKNFSGTWKFLHTESGTQAQWFYHLQLRKKYRFLEPFIRLYFYLESRRRLSALAKYCQYRTRILANTDEASI